MFHEQLMDASRLVRSQHLLDGVGQVLPVDATRSELLEDVTEGLTEVRDERRIATTAQFRRSCGIAQSCDASLAHGPRRAAETSAHA